MDDWQFAPSTNAIIITVIVVLVIVGLIILIVALINSGQSTSSNNTSSQTDFIEEEDEDDSDDEDSDDDGAFNAGPSKPGAPAKLGGSGQQNKPGSTLTFKPTIQPTAPNPVDEAAREAELASVEEFLVGEVSDQNGSGLDRSIASDYKLTGLSADSGNDTPKISTGSKSTPVGPSGDETPKISTSGKAAVDVSSKVSISVPVGSAKVSEQAEASLSIDLMSEIVEDSGQSIDDDVPELSGDNLEQALDATPHISDEPVIHSDPTPKISDITAAPALSDTLPEVSELSPSEVEAIAVFEAAEQPKQTQSSSTPLIDTMNKSQNQAPAARPLVPQPEKITPYIPPIVGGKASNSSPDDTSGLTVEASMTNPASLSSDFSNPTEMSEKKGVKSPTIAIPSIPARSANPKPKPAKPVGNPTKGLADLGKNSGRGQ